MAGAWRAAVGEALRAGVDALWPRRCWLCGGVAPDGLACSSHALPEHPAGPRCGRCAAALAPALTDGTRCAACRLRPPRFRSAVVVGDYRGGEPLREWILALKHGGRADLAAVLGGALARRLGGAGPPGALLVPVPLHPWRRLERGYDQAALLADAIAEAGGMDCVRALRRRRATPPQGAPGASSRRANVEGAFRVPGRRRAELAGRPVWLVDDVLTSGATASACAGALRRAGSGEVHVLAVGRAAPPGGLLP